jgi:hypothetical protein
MRGENKGRDRGASVAVVLGLTVSARKALVLSGMSQRETNLVWWFRNSLSRHRESSREFLNQNHTSIIFF